MSVEPADIIILVLRVLLVACLYGFLATVMRLASRSLRTATATTSSAAPPMDVRRPSAQPANLRLIVVEPGGSGLRAGQAFDINQVAVLGRAERADVVLPDGAVSSEHARVQRAGRGWVLTDLGSTNGTRLNGAAVPANGQVAITAGDVVAVGPVQLQVAPR
jgi:pSer/pThr/pTyr-binding forkhead associated (FHA) protein